MKCIVGCMLVFVLLFPHAVLCETFEVVLPQTIRNVPNHTLQIRIHGLPQETKIRAQAAGISFSPAPALSSDPDLTVLSYWGSNRTVIPALDVIDFSETLPPGTKIEIQDMFSSAPMAEIVVGQPARTLTPVEKEKVGDAEKTGEDLETCRAHRRSLIGGIQMFNMEHGDSMTVLSEDALNRLQQENYVKTGMVCPAGGTFTGINLLTQEIGISCSIHGPLR